MIKLKQQQIYENMKYLLLMFKYKLIICIIFYLPDGVPFLDLLQHGRTLFVAGRRAPALHQRVQDQRFLNLDFAHYKNTFFLFCCTKMR